MLIGVVVARYCEPTYSPRETLDIGKERLGACVSFLHLKRTI
jgi:hypothetical protein